MTPPLKTIQRGGDSTLPLRTSDDADAVVQVGDGTSFASLSPWYDRVSERASEWAGSASGGRAV